MSINLETSSVVRRTPIRLASCIQSVVVDGYLPHTAEGEIAHIPTEDISIKARVVAIHSTFFILSLLWPRNLACVSAVREIRPVLCVKAGITAYCLVSRDAASRVLRVALQ